MSEKNVDLGLIARFTEGDLEAFSEIVTKYAQRVQSLAFRITRNEEDAEDVGQEVFITVFTKIHSFKGQSAFSSWLYRVTANAAFMKLRKRRQTHIVCLDEEVERILENLWASDEDPAKNAIRIEIRETVEAALNALPTDYRAIFVLRDVDKLTNEEVAMILGASVAAVKSRLHRARLILRKKLLGTYKIHVPCHTRTRPMEQLRVA